MALIEFEEYRQKLHDLKPAIEELGQAYNLEHAAEEVEELENRASEPGFWDDTEKSQKILQRTKALKDKIEGYHNLCGQQEDLLTLCDLAIEMDDDSMIDELRCKQCDSFVPCRCRRNRSTGLVRHAVSHVHPLGGAPRLQL